MAQYDPSLAYADYFAVGGGGAVTATLVPEAEAGDEDGLYGAVHQPGAGMFGVRGLVVPAEMAAAAASAAHGKQAALGDFFVLGDDHAQQQQHHHHQTPFTSLSLHGPSEAASLMLHQQLGGGATRHHQHQHQHQAWPQPGAWHLRGSRFLLPAQQLLQEFCSIPVETTASKPPAKPANEDGGASSSALSAQIQAMDAAELQRLKAKLYAMLEEVDRRYRRYREQMRAVAGSFEAVAGERAAAAYTRLASRTISRHFRVLRDGVASQMQAVRGALGEKDTAGGVSPKAETTPRLRALDQCLRQHRAFQAGVLESQPWRPQRGLPERAVSILRAWLFEHFLHPYPSDVDKHILARQTGLSRSQVSNWFINARVRLWKPMVEDMYTEEMKDEGSGGGGSGGGSSGNARNSNPSSYISEGRCRGKEEGGGERKPTRAQLLRDAGSLASVVSVGNNRDQNVSFGMMDDDHLDFDAYDIVDAHAVADGHQGFGGSVGRVSLTLGLQQHADDDPHGPGGVNVAFAGAPTHEFLFMEGGEQQMVAGGGMHTGGHGHHGAGGEAVSHYHRGLGATGFQFLHDLAG